LYAFCTVRSRSFLYMPPPNYDKFLYSLDEEERDRLTNTCLEPSGLKSCPCLLPLLDMLNHWPGTKISWLSTPNHIEFVNEANIDAQRQVYNNYGPKGNEELLMSYGFCLDSDCQVMKLLDYVRITLCFGSEGRKTFEETVYLKPDDESIDAYVNLFPKIFGEVELTADLMVVAYEMLYNKWKESCKHNPEPFEDCNVHRFNLARTFCEGTHP
jgi:hypothetical protein